MHTNGPKRGTQLERVIGAERYTYVPNSGNGAIFFPTFPIIRGAVGGTLNSLNQYLARLRWGPFSLNRVCEMDEAAKALIVHELAAPSVPAAAAEEVEPHVEELLKVRLRSTPARWMQLTFLSSSF